MPDLTPDDLATIAQAPAEAAADGQSAKAHPLGDVIKVADRQAAASAATGTNAAGGPRSAWGMLRPARAQTEGA